MTTFNDGVLVSPGSTDELTLLGQAKLKILQAMASGASVVKEIEIRGRVVKHNDLPSELEAIDNRIKLLNDIASGNRHLRPARTRARLGR